jgi:hypothetical protein
MKSDIRLDSSFLTHRKRKKLQKALGEAGVLALVDLWLSASENRPKGILTGMTEMDIAIDAQWTGDPVLFCRTLVEIGFLESSKDGTYSFHEWRDHQPWVFGSKERVKRAIENALKRWQKNDEQKEEVSATRIAQSNAPSPSPKKRKRDLKKMISQLKPQVEKS